MPSLPCNNIRTSRPRGAVLLTVMLTGLLCTIAPSMRAAASAWQTDLSQQTPGVSETPGIDLPISFPVQSPEIAAYFADIARPGDIASIAPTHLFLLSQATVGQKMVAFRSWTEAQAELDKLTSPVDIVMYNPEHWELTPQNEQQDLAVTVQQFASFVHARGLRFMFAPDRRYAEAYLSQVAPDIDAVLLQGQQLQYDPDAFATWMLGMTELAREVNPEMQIFVQVGATLGTASEMYAAIQTVSDKIDGIAIWSMPRSLDVLQEFVDLLREGAPVEGATPSATPAVTVPAPVSTASPTVPPPSATPTEVGSEHLTATALSAQAMPTSTPGMAPTSDQSAASVTAATVPGGAVAPTSAGPQEQSEGSFLNMGWLTDLLLFLGGIGFGLVIGFFLGWKLGPGARG